MKLLVLDGNSILNRAFYGIKLLTTKDGRFTNGIYGFLNILLKLREQVEPDAVGIAFDMRAPTFRHKMYDGYKAQRKGMPAELAQQMPVLKQLLSLLGYRIIEAEGWEADDILGTLAKASTACGGECYIATGDRDSLQLVADKVFVMLAATKMGRPEATVYDVEKIREEYGIEPKQLIEVKGLMGDSSDNIPGVAGVGQKTALDLVQRYKSIDYIYDNIDSIDIKEGVRQKLKNGKDMAFLSRKLGTISTDAPIDCSCDLKEYVPTAGDAPAASRLLANLEMFKMIERFGLSNEPGTDVQNETKVTKDIDVRYETDLNGFLQKLKSVGNACFLTKYDENGISDILFIEHSKITIIKHDLSNFDKFMADFLADEKIEKSTHDTKPLHAFAIRNNIEIGGIEMDSMLAAYLLNPSSSDYEIMRLAKEYSVSVPNIDGGDDELKDYIQKVAVLPLLCEKFEALTKEYGQHKLLHLIEIPLAKVLAGMELHGFEVDRDGIEEFGKQLDIRINEIVSEVYEQVGYEFNLNSPKQLGEALFVKLGLPSKKKTKTGYSTNAEVLESLADEHPVVAMVLEYRTLSKLKTTYCDGLVKAIGKDGRIHSTLNQTETRTGRISSTEPNLQNIPVRQEVGRELRRYFRAKDGCMLIDADYSQIELRVLANIADDREMMKAFNDGIDIHAVTASQVFNMPLPMVTPLMRSRAKAVNFGIVYGIGAFSLAKDIGVSRAEAGRYIKEYLNHYSGVREYMEKVVEEAKQNGYAETLFGRRRYLPELTSSNANIRAFGERVARNMPIQGTAADIIKIAMIKTENRLKKEGLVSYVILQVHDELIVESPLDEVDAASKILKEEMEAACKMNVRLLADVHVGKTWYDAKG